jgi:hypothetical protein
LEIDFLDFDKIMSRLRKEEKNYVYQWFKSELAGYLPSARIDKLNTIEKLARTKASKSRETGKKWQDFVVDAVLDLHREGISGRKISGKRINYIFGHRSGEKYLYGPIERYFKNSLKKCEVCRAYKEPVRARIQLEDGRSGSVPDLLVLRKGTKSRWKRQKRRFGLGSKQVFQRGSPDELIVVDAKIAPKELQRFHNQLTYYKAVADKVYLAATTKLIREVGRETLISRQLKPYGVGLIHVDMTNREKPCDIKLPSKKSRHKAKQVREQVISKCFPAK